MKRVFCLLALLAGAAATGRAQDDGYSSIGIGYSAANVAQPKFADFLVRVNDENPGLTKPFSTEELHQGFNVFMEFGSGKGKFTLGLARMGLRHRAEGVVPLISPNSARYRVTTRLTQVAALYDWFPVRVLGIGAEGGYSYSTIRDSRKDLIFGETNQVVDKKGGLHAGLHLTLHLPFRNGAFIELQPYYLRALYQNDMDNVTVVYLGTGNGEARKTPLSATGVHVRFGVKIR